MIELTEEKIKTQNRKSSKGNQMKFEQGGIWYKTDYLGYEGLSEYIVSHLLIHFSLPKEDFVLYDLEQVSYNGNVFQGCKSRDFSNGWQLITLERLLEQTYGHGLNRIVYAIDNHTERLRTLVQLVERITGLEFGSYISRLLTLDAFFLNEDRHAHNLAVMTNERREFRLCPVFDNGACLLSDLTLEYPLQQDCIRLIQKARPKTFCQSFDEQLEIAEALYGQHIRFSFGYNEIQSFLSLAENYSSDIRQRVAEILMQQRRKYLYLFH